MNDFISDSREWITKGKYNYQDTNTYQGACGLPHELWCQVELT